MIRKLRIKFIAASMLSLTLVLLVILGGINAMSYQKTVSDADAILSVLASNQGTFPQRLSPVENGDARRNAPGGKDADNGVFRKRGLSDETPYESQCHLVKQMAEEEYLREKMIYRKESHLLFFAVRQKDRWTSASK